MSLSASGSFTLSRASSFGSRAGLEEFGADERTPLKGHGSVPSAGFMNLTLLMAILAVTIGSSFQFGYGTGVMNNSEPFIRSYFMGQGKQFTLVQWSVTVSMYGVGGLLGAIIGPKFIGRFVGRKATLMINNVFLFGSSYLIAFGEEWWVLATGRVLIGIVAGIATAVVPTYLSEISPIAIRGAVSTMHQLGITIGILVSQFLSTPSLNLFGCEEKWQWLFLVPVGCGIFELIVLPFVPESPSYLFKTQGRGAARIALARLQSPEVVDEYMSYIEQESISEMATDSRGISVMGLFRDLSIRKQLIVGITVQLMMQFSGIDAVFYYSTTVFYQADVPDPELATTLLGVINVLITVIAVRYMDTAGRKALLIWSWYGMFTSYLILTVSFVVKPYVEFADTLSVVAMIGVISFFAFGPGCIAWFIIAETFSLYARDSAMALGIAINWVANWLVAFTFPLLLSVTQPFTFLLFVASTFYFLVFTYRYVPETKGKTIAQVTEEFQVIDLPTKCC